ncbi:aspartate--tRNA ligase [Streptomyces azureus]|uniref:Aspartate--tRNA ligase n=1 Tax=Streptomyces azureus TaxID=146537 RepID=A0A0K8PVH6_STRAJ|nr:aspartate--tRNA ligase [Streptomyces azureus]
MDAGADGVQPVEAGVFGRGGDPVPDGGGHGGVGLGVDPEAGEVGGAGRGRGAVAVAVGRRAAQRMTDAAGRRAGRVWVGFSRERPARV